MGPISKSTRKAKTPGPAGNKKADILKRRALSEGGPASKSKLSQSETKTPKAKTPKKLKVADEKMKLMYGEGSDEEDGTVIPKTPVSVKGKKTPKSSSKSKPDAAEENASATPKGKTPKDKAQKSLSVGKKTPKSSKSKPDAAEKNLPVTPKVKTPKMVKQKSMSEGAKLKKSDGANKSVGKKEPASAGGKLKKQTTREELSQLKLPFNIEDDYDEDEDDDFDMDDDSDDTDDSDDDDVTEIDEVVDDSVLDDDDEDEDFDDDEEDEDEDSDEDADDDEDIDDGVLDDDDEDEDFDEDDDDDESGSSYSDDSDISLESNDDESDDEITFNQSAKRKTSEAKEATKMKKTSKADKTQEMTKLVPKPDEQTKPSKTPKSALKTPGTAKSTGKKVSIVVTSPDKEMSSKKVVTTPHPSLTKKRRPEMAEVDNDKENVDENGVSSAKKASKKDKKGKGKTEEEPLHKQLSFGDEEDDEEVEKKTVQKGKVKAGKRKLEEKDEDESDEEDSDDESLTHTEDDDGIYYHCGNLPTGVDKQLVTWFFAEADVDLDKIYLKKEKVVRTEVTDVKRSKKKYRKKETKVHHCYAILKCSSMEDAKKLDALNGSEFTATDGKWRTYNLAIYPMIKGSNGIKEENCVHIRPLNHKTTDDDLEEFFKENEVQPQKVRIARRGIRQISKGFAFAWFRSPADVKKAMKLSGKEVQGFKLNVTKAKPKVQGRKKYNYTIGSNLDIKERDTAKVDLKKKIAKVDLKKKKKK